MDGLKQRVIGALVLVCLAVIFVPMLFDEPHTDRSSRVIDIPEEPPFPEVQAPPVPEQDAPSYHLEESTNGSVTPMTDNQLVESNSQTPAATSESGTAAPAETEPPVSGEQAAVAPMTEPEPEQQQETTASDGSESAEYTRSLEGAWVVQLGSFGDVDNARRLRENVRKKGYDSHIQRVEKGDTVFTRVFSGPFASKSDAEVAKKRLDAEFNLNGLVTSSER
ncbi:SPOR domain-containing protein [Marinobacter caseinilyticus]|uniref:SPOR domain-containing protein n=1 Tax=Marinobacter caseinilyticus TaxID=2692195 RepID=UPI001409D014|nr:SPOR domain-containing protein [Marinobacter caseinilyticus]